MRWWPSYGCSWLIWSIKPLNRHELRKHGQLLNSHYKMLHFTKHKCAQIKCLFTVMIFNSLSNHTEQQYNVTRKESLAANSSVDHVTSCLRIWYILLETDHLPALRLFHCKFQRTKHITRNKFPSQHLEIILIWLFPKCGVKLKDVNDFVAEWAQMKDKICPFPVLETF